MSQQVKVSRSLVFGDSANNTRNVEGNFNPEKCYFRDDFTGADIAAYWTQSDDNGGTVAIGTSGVGGTVTLTTGAADDDRAIITGSLNWYAAKNCVMEARVKADRITLASFGVGFTDATTEGNDLQPFSVSAATVTDTCTDGAAIVFDTDETTDYFWIVNTKNNTEGGNILPVTAPGYVPVADTYVTLRVAIDTSGNANYFINGNCVGSKKNALTAATALCPYVSAINRAGAALVVTVDYIACWQDR